ISMFAQLASRYLRFVPAKMSWVRHVSCPHELRGGRCMSVEVPISASTSHERLTKAELVERGEFMFRDREDAARRLAARLKGREFHGPIVLAIPRGGIIVGAVLARKLNADLDVVLARKLRAPGQPELAIGALGEDGQVFVNPQMKEYLDLVEDYLSRERAYQ